ncbi:MAG TPA: ABC transporter ATP-binding protein, partial [Actinomycetota bacterium]|nr:ABC transporter ATP-binding protein [Actinomycetota bacterium]
MDMAVAIDGVSKRFKLYRERPTSLKERVVSFRRAERAVDFWALRDISAEIPTGTTVGLIGANGSGKTTLLKIIGGIIRPTSGEVRTRGRIAALLELGAGFHPELTGRENVYLNASILGLSRRETDRYFDRIVEFSELERFIDNQVKHYSSGMFVRLGFAVAIHVDPDILLVDEVLAVGDEAFQRKCLDRVAGFQEEGRTMIIVSHDADLVARVCDQAIMLDGGRVRAAGEAVEVVKDFHTHMLKIHAPFVREDVTKEVEIRDVRLLNRKGEPPYRGVRAGDPLTVQVDIEAKLPVRDPVVSMAIYDGSDRLMFKTGTDWTQMPLGTV